jgi:1,4-alpha-glucan branching enzyme
MTIEGGRHYGGGKLARSGTDAGRDAPVENRPSLLTSVDLHLFNEGTHSRLYEKLGAHVLDWEGATGVYFSVWAPNATAVSVIGDFNGWDDHQHPLITVGSSGIWEGFVAGARPGQHYKFWISPRVGPGPLVRGDPVAFLCESAPRTAATIWDLAYDWGDSVWMERRASVNSLEAPIAIYEVHLGSWMRVPEEGDRSLTYRELATRLADYVSSMGFTHVEFMPVMEHPFYGSWGYQVTGFFAPTSRYGTPQDFMYLVDTLHQRGIGVILDWVPSHFPADEHGLASYDGTHLYEHADPRLGVHPDWGGRIFNFGRHEVRSFLLSSALFWLDRYHADGLRVDGVASLLYLDYSRRPGEWLPNRYGGRENLDAVSFLRQLNEAVYARHPDVQTIAEESTAWPMVSRPTYVGGLGFGFKWDMGWMHDTLKYMRLDPVYRKFHHDTLTFRALYAFNENFVLPLSHDEVVHGKGSLLGKMPSDDWRKFANLRLLYAYMYLSPGKKLLFMGDEFGQWREWDHDRSLDHHLLADERHLGLQRLVGDLNALYRSLPELHQTDADPSGFEWLDCHDSESSTLSFLRRSHDGERLCIVVCNFTPVPRQNFRIGAPAAGWWREVMNSDAREYGGSGHGNLGGAATAPIPSHGHPQSLVLTLPPLGAVALTWSHNA